VGERVGGRESETVVGERERARVGEGEGERESVCARALRSLLSLNSHY
jgi:hypothetical protein